MDSGILVVEKGTVFALRRYLVCFAPIFGILAFAFTGCGGSTNSTPVPASALANPSATVTAGAAPGSASVTHPSGYGANITLPITSDGSSGSVAVSITTSLPSGLASLSSMKRTPKTIGATLTPLVYVVLTPTTNLTFSSTPGFTFTLPSATAVAAGSSAWVAFYDPAQSASGWLTILGPGNVSGHTIAFPAATGSVTLKAGTSYAFALFTTSQQLAAATAQCAPHSAPPSTLPSPAPINANHIALQFVVDSSAQSGAPNVCPANVYIYIYSNTNNVYVTDAAGDTAPITSSAVPGIPFYGGSFTGGSVSQVIQLPNLVSARVYFSVNGSLSIKNGTAPQPWAMSAGTNFPTIFDDFEYTSPAFNDPSPSLDINTTQIQMIGLDYTIQVNGVQAQGGASTFETSGLLPGFMSAVHSYAASLQPWAGVMFTQWPTRIIGPNAVQFTPGGNPNVIGFVSPGGQPPTPGGEFLDSAIETAWDAWTPTNCMEIGGQAASGNFNGINPSATPIYGAVDLTGTPATNPNFENFNFYNPAVVTSCTGIATASASAIVTTLPSPFNQIYWAVNNQQGPPCTTATSWFTATSSVLLQSGPFVAPTSLDYCVSNQLQTAALPGNVAYPILAGKIGNYVSTAINRGLFNAASSADQTQPECTGNGAFLNLYTNTNAYLNLYAAALWNAVHKNLTPVSNIPPNATTPPSPTQRAGVYGIPYDDACSYSSDLSFYAAQSVVVTINGN